MKSSSLYSSVSVDNFSEMNFVETGPISRYLPVFHSFLIPAMAKTTNLSLSILFTNEHFAKRIVFFHDWQNIEKQRLFRPPNKFSNDVIGRNSIIFLSTIRCCCCCCVYPSIICLPTPLWAFLRFDSSSKTDTIDKNPRLLNPLSSFHQVIAQQRANHFCNIFPNLSFGSVLEFAVWLASCCCCCCCFVCLFLSSLPFISRHDLFFKEIFFFGSLRGVSFFFLPHRNIQALIWKG